MRRRLLHDRNVGITEAFRARRRQFRETVVAIVQDSARRWVRHQLDKTRLKDAIRDRYREERMAVSIMSVLPHVEERDLTAIRKHLPDITRRYCRNHIA